MDIESRKLRIIAAFTSLKDIKKISQIESLLLPKSNLNNRQLMLENSSDLWSKKEADDIKKIIEEGCEKIDEDGW